MAVSRKIPDLRSPGTLSGVLLLSVFLLCLVPSSVSALPDQPGQVRNVLVLNSYHPTFTWTASQSDGIIETLEKSGLNLSVSVEYLDWKNYPDKKTLDNVTGVYRSKYSQHPFDVILTTDDAALSYVIGHRSDIFGDAPVVFSGANNYALLDPAQRANITGKTEEISPEKTLSSVFMLFPSTSRIYILTEDTETGRGIADRIRGAEPSYRDRAEFTYITNITFDEMATTVRTFPQGSVIISAFTRDRNGTVMDHDRVMALLKANAPVPVFSMYDMAMGHGAIGGSILSGRHEGEIAGEMAVRILKGESITAVPVNTGDTTLYMFDKDQLDRFFVPEGRLPEGSTVLNRVPGMLDLYFFEVVAAVFVIIILLICIVVLTFNIRQRKKAEVALLESERKYRTILDSIQDVFYRADQDGNLVMVSPSGAELFGVDTTDELIGMNLAGHLYLNPDDRQTFLAVLGKDGIVRDYEVTLKRKDGTPVTVSTTSHICFGPDGTPAGVEGILRDITPRKKAEDALRESERKCRAIFDQTYEFTGLLTPEGKLLEANRSSLEFIGLQESDVAGRLFWDTPWWAHSRDLQEKLRGAVEDAARGDFVRFEATHPAADGSLHYVDFSIKPVKDASGRVIMLIPEGRDITERRKTEEYFIRANSLKEKLLGTAALENRLQLITDEVVSQFGADFARIWLVREGDLCGKGCIHTGGSTGMHTCRNRASCLHLIASSGRYTRTDGSHRRVPMGSYKIGRVASGEDSQFITNDAANDPQVHDHAWARSLGLVAFAGFRLLSHEGRPIGVLALFRNRAIDPQEEKLLQDLANTTAQVIRTGMVETELKESESRLRGVSNNIPGVIYQFYARPNGEMGFYYVSERSREILGIDNAPDDYFSRFTSCIVPADREPFLSSIDDAVRNVTRWEWEGAFVQPDGKEMYVRGMSEPVKTETEIIFSGVLLDTTERKMAEITLRQATKKLTLLNAITFTDIQNAIFSLSGYLELEKQYPLDEKLQQYISKQIRIVRAISDSLKFADLYQSLGLKPPAWQNAEQSFLLAVSHMDISELSRQLEVNGLEIYADPLLENVFFTLAENVVLHGKTATGIVFRYQESQEGLTLFFEDNGIGIQSDMKEKIFDRRYEEKRGMGLFLIREILSITGITIRETGEPGKGARFEIIIPKGVYRFTGRR